jgi:ABC-2 type transport system permease protein
MRDILVIARREFLERVRTKAFIIGTILGPILMGGMMFVPVLMSRSVGKALRIAVVDETGSLRSDVEAALTKSGEADPRTPAETAARSATGDPSAAAPRGATRFEVRPATGEGIDAQRGNAKDAILKGELDAYVFLPIDVLVSSRAEYFAKNVADFDSIRAVDRAVESALIERRLTTEGIDPAKLKTLTKPLDLKRLRVSESGAQEDRGASFLFSMLMMMMIYMGVMLWGQAVMTGVIEEKTNRVVEVIASSTSPQNLLFGKLLGVGSAGLLQFGAWIATAVILSVVSGSFAFLSGMQMPEINPWVIVAFPVFFLLGFFLYAALYAAIGSAVNSTQEAQNLVLPVMMPIIIAIVCWPVVMRAPESTLSTVLSLIPFMTPILMFLRMTLLMPPLWQILLSIALTATTIAGVIWVAGRIYRVGILMYGKPPNFPELVRWIRHG